MKKTVYHIILSVLVFSFSKNALAQHDTAQLLKEPANWEFERFPLPPVFAPSFPYKGVEELRFAPGMFKKDAADYFTYAFVAQLDNTVAVTWIDIQNYLLLYYKGLCSATAKDRKLSIDTSKIMVSVGKEAKEDRQGRLVYNVTADIFGVFADGEPVKLNMEVTVINKEAAKRTFLLFLASPLKREDAIWKRLYQIQNDFTVPL